VLQLQSVTIALTGNPNSGKTSLFNSLTGARQHVGNYPGVTVEKKEGVREYRNLRVQVTDLPGAYSLTSFSPEELVARRCLLETPPDLVVDILDGSNLERNLYLAVQLMELQVPLLLVCNMMDVVESRGDKIDFQKLASTLGLPIVPMVAHRGQGVDLLLESVLQRRQNTQDGVTRSRRPRYDLPVESAIEKIAAQVSPASNPRNYPADWIAIKLLEGDPAVMQDWKDTAAAQTAAEEARALSARYSDSIESVIASQRYGYIAQVCEIAHKPSVGAGATLSDRIDAVVTHRVWGLPIFLMAMFLIFAATFTLGQYPSDWLSNGVAWLGEKVGAIWPEGSQSPLRSLLVDGVIAGVGNVIVFVPNILILFLAIGLLEDTGYMARAAFIMDRIMHRIGLHGKSFIPLLLGFGCSVPAILATRTLENRRDRLTTMLVAPMMSCGARLPIYALIIPAFFATRWQAPMLWMIYLIGIVVAIGSARLLRSTLFQGEPAPFVMELPPYRLPRLRDLLLHVYERASLYLKKAGTVILGISILLWALTNYPKPPAASAASAEKSAQQQADDLGYSVAGRIGKAIEPVLKPMGFDWRIGTALIGAVAAKEVFVAQMGIVYAAAGEDEESTLSPLREQLRQHYSPLIGFCIMLFCLLSMPCMATFAVTLRESGSWRWALFQSLGMTALAYIVTTCVYQLGQVLS
jgi:ferrous iron transport protein B